MDYIWYYKKRGKSHKYIELVIIKDFLYSEVDKIHKEINKESEKAEKANIPNHLINIFINVLEERKKLLNHLVNEVKERIKNEDNK